MLVMVLDMVLVIVIVKEMVKATARLHPSTKPPVYTPVSTTMRSLLAMRSAAHALLTHLVLTCAAPHIMSNTYAGLPTPTQ